MGFRLTALLLASVAALSLTGCDRIRNVGEAGRFLDEGGFGDPTMNNVLVMTGQRSYVEELSTRFAQEVPTTINFAFDSATLTQDARAVLRQQARWILQFPEVRFSVYGHTDLVGSDAYNYNLGLRRARTAVNYLVSQGIERSRLEALVSLGETQPLVATQDREQRNRRTVTEVSGFVQNHPTVLDGRYADIVYRAYGGPRSSTNG
ncbi:OmpA family protein [Nioella nitratireducens]|uniref:OmpA family protein n=1 Tax=Nioella nitratireducens TaxID=1287720 RepID=UPI0008FD4DBA|nr:OmpA family protein [Nioella nitratireducens]